MSKPKEIHVQSPKLSAAEIEKLMPKYMLKWEKMYKKYAGYELARRMMKTKAYRDYIQRWPYDFRERIISIDDMFFIQDPAQSVEDEVAARIRFDDIEASLSPRQAQVWRELKEGKRTYAIKDVLQFNTEGAVRYNKHMIKKRFHEDE